MRYNLQYTISPRQWNQIADLIGCVAIAVTLFALLWIQMALV